MGGVFQRSGLLTDDLVVREYPGAGPRVALIHGGPGAAGYMTQVARTLAPAFHVIEPLQRRSGGGPLTVARHVEDLREALTAPALLVGHSWGAMLTLAFAAAHPARARALVLIGCGTFDAVSRARFESARWRRLDDDARRRLAALTASLPDPDARLRAAGELLLPACSYDLASAELPLEWCDAAGYREAWDDMMRLQAEGVYPEVFAAIKAPVLMLHGADDPHPGALIEASLRPHLPQLEYHQLDRCGHYPWLERHAREPFFAALETWLAARA